MHSAIFVWASLLLIGSVSISQGYRNNHEDSDENQINEFVARTMAPSESSEFNARSESLIESSESKRDAWSNTALKKRQNSCNSCKTACKADEVCLSSGVCTCPGGWGASPCPTQHHGLCSSANTAGLKPAASIDFGEGSAKYSPKTPAQLGFTTSYTQKNVPQLNDGFFTIANEIPQDFTGWLAGTDYTKGCASGTTKGYMMVVNGQYIANNNILSIKADKLCAGLVYEFSFYAANIVQKENNIQLPNFKIDVTSATGSKAVLATSTTGPLPEQPTLTWVKYGLSFVATSTSVVGSLTSLTPGGSGNDFAIDDVRFVSCSPNTNGAC